MPTKAQNEAIRLYAALMEEIKHRIAAIDYCTAGQFDVPSPFVHDFCYLQIRMICELIALGCLVAHGDISRTTSKRMQKEWSAEKIMRALEELHPHFYPKPVRLTHTTSPFGVHLQAVDSSLPKAEFMSLYQKCGEALHRGNVKKLLNGQLPVQINFPDITKKVQKIAELLQRHILVMQSGEQMFICILRNASDNGRVQVAIVETPRGEPMDFASPQFLRDPP